MKSIGAVTSQAGKSMLFLSEFTRDLMMYTRYCGISPLQDKRKKQFYKIIIETHAIEKGLSLANPRPLFGQAKIRDIMRQVRSYGIRSDELPVTMAIGALTTYRDVHRAKGLGDPILDEIDAFLADRARASATAGVGGVRLYPEGLPAPGANPASLLTERVSSRIYDAAPLDREAITRIVQVAQSAPSQCNRQATRVHYYDDPAQVRALLTLQAGSAGFSEGVPGLFVVAFDLAAWGGAQQRNQGYVDGALFAMTLMLSARAHGAVTCPLNLAVKHGTERLIREAGAIPEDQRLVMMIAIGRPGAGASKAAASPRRPVGEVLTLPGADGGRVPAETPAA